MSDAALKRVTLTLDAARATANDALRAIGFNEEETRVLTEHMLAAPHAEWAGHSRGTK